MTVVTEMKMPLWPAEYKRLVSGEDCKVEAKKAVRELLQRTMEEALVERPARVRAVHGREYVTAENVVAALPHQRFRPAIRRSPSRVSHGSNSPRLSVSGRIWRA